MDERDAAPSAAPGTDVGPVDGAHPPPPPPSGAPLVQPGELEWIPGHRAGRAVRLVSGLFLLGAGAAILSTLFLPWRQDAGFLAPPGGRRYTGWDLATCWRGRGNGCGIYFGDSPPRNPREVVVAVMVSAVVFVVVGSVTLWTSGRRRRVPWAACLSFGWAAVLVGGAWSLLAQANSLVVLWGWKVANAGGLIALVGMILFTIARPPLVTQPS